MDTKTALITATIGALIPWLTAFITAQSAPSWLKGAVTLLLTAGAGVLTAWQADPGYDLGRGVLYALEGWVIAVASHAGLWRPVGLTGGNGIIQSRIRGGLGDTR
ncbi:MULTISPECIES: hypothetical protein [unclassified Frankia]|uniref:hypothetical protein n=1 Tax=unclassified Frankia TaxID=2632575 RepID=UPI001EF5E7DB|nr:MULTISPECIES: hypothetical protein [unclassified Frankia]